MSSRLPNELMLQVAAFLPTSQLQLVHTVHVSFWYIWMIRKYAHCIVTDDNGLGQLSYNGAACAFVSTLSVQSSFKTPWDPVLVASTFSRLRQLRVLHVLWNGCGPYDIPTLRHLLALPANTQQIGGKLTKLSLSIPICMLDTLDALQLPGLASFSFTFHTGFIEAHIIELNLRHLIIFLRKTVGLKELAIRVDETSCNLNLGFLFMHLGTLEYLEKLSLMMPPLDRFDASHPDILFPIISFIRGHRDKLLDITLKSNAMFVFGTPTDSEVHCWPWRLLDAINFESLVRLDVGAVPFNWLVEFLRSHRRTLHHLTLSADVFPFLPDRLLSLDRELSDSPLGLSRIREVSLTLRSLTPRLLVYILKHFPAAQHLAISYLTTPPPSTFYEQLRKMLIEEGVATSLERTFEFTTVRIRGIVEGPELLQFIYQALQETIGGIVCQGDFVDDEDE